MSDMTLEGPENSASPVNKAPVSIRHTEIDPILLHERFVPAQTDSDGHGSPAGKFLVTRTHIRIQPDP
jgi:hypothetical protein